MIWIAVVLAVVLAAFLLIKFPLDGRRYRCLACGPRVRNCEICPTCNHLE
jgi:hypothetical protein